MKLTKPRSWLWCSYWYRRRGRKSEVKAMRKACKGPSQEGRPAFQGPVS